MTHDHRFSEMHLFYVAGSGADYALLGTCLGALGDDCAECYESALDRMAQDPATVTGFIALVRAGANDVMGPAAQGLRRGGGGGFRTSLPTVLEALDDGEFEDGLSVVTRLPAAERRRAAESAVGVFVALMSALSQRR